MKTVLMLSMFVLARALAAQEMEDYPALPRALYRSGQSVLDSFAPVSAQTRHSVVELNVNGSPVALGAIVDTNGLVVTKASEISAGKLTCWLATGQEVEAQLLEIDDDDDVALVRVKAKGLKPIPWATDQVKEGQWVITPCLATTPLAVGIVSSMPHKVQAQRAFIGVGFDVYSTRPVVDFLEPGFGAEEAGVKPGDIILTVDGATVTNSAQVREILRGFRDGQTVRMRFKRAAQEFDASIKMMAPKAGLEGYDYMDEQESELSGDVSVRSEGFDEALEHDTVLEPWQCGGPLVNLDGKMIGLNIARASRFASYALPASLARQIVARLKAKVQNP